MAATATYLERYVASEHEQVWAELISLGKQVREEPLYSDAWAVARETMRRVRTNIEQLIPRLVQVGFIFGYDHLIRDILHKPLLGADWIRYLEILGWARAQPPIFLPARLAEEYRSHVIALDLGDLADDPDIFNPGVAAPNMRSNIEELERVAGPLPLSLRAWYEQVGAVNFYGYHPGWTRLVPMADDLSAYRDRYLMSYCDPLEFCVLDDMRMQKLLDLHGRGQLHQFEFADDPYFKDYTGGSSTPFAFAVPNPTMDDTLDSYEHGLTFVQYLRRCIRWAGFPGMAEWKDVPQDELAFVTENLVPF